METIFAQSSAQGRAGVAVFRISGPKSLDSLKMLTRKKNFKPRFMYYQKLIDPETGELIDNAMVVYFPSPASFTGEETIEIYVHGSKAIAIMLTSVLLNIAGLRIAEAGEFTKRAFLNGKFDLTAAEGIADLIEAETIMQHKQAIRQAGGALEDLYNGWRASLLRIISLLEAYIDFPDEDIPNVVLTEVMNISTKLKDELTSYLNDNRRGELLRSGIQLAIVGAPNVGKSSLLNFLMQREIAIVSNIAGTTRDIIEGHLDIGGYPIILQDTAGIRSGSNDLIEQEGIKRAIESAKKADIKIIMFDVEQLILLDSNLNEAITDLIDNNTIIIINKIDLSDLDKVFSIEDKYNCLKVSIKENIGMQEILKNIENIAADIAGLTETPYITKERHRRYLKQALAALTSFNLEKDLVLATEDIRMTIRAISAITGSINIEEILGEIFKNFCIGK
ncbi:tRNA uridine-5-carboxymethylaminomethyl(34) synthesis GTPase MnmE [Rickettsia endosymbiont of Orchestes rusci]|uniref:tRNA uridine-5-carboxymethylaminomethyl(34) synthesis GTPase MnmE n=1 Tax=Rickettsia endosymbiont of Orchestes rusci TaxID=3066250 RepID=UPI00209D5533|nr:tRNA uridine-5-carboxymethylaminomethyl(34) synthesis GTPase MnmE [Rickettsia endosymbiont of Ceutorhynchus assimilis]